MQSNAHITKPMDWGQVEWLMSAMSNYQDSSEYNQRKYAMYQVSIACGCYFGPTARELFSIRWKDIRGVGAYIFRCEPERSPLVIPPELRAIIDQNHTFLRPFSERDYVISTVDNQKPVWSKVYNNVLAKVLYKFGIYIPNASAQTLRRTFALKVWHEFDNAQQASKELSKELNYPAADIPNYIKR